MYDFYIKQEDFDNCKNQIKIAQKEIAIALSIIEDNINKVSIQTQTFLQSMISDWTYRKLVADAQIFEPSAKIKKRNSDFIGALDEYITLLEKYEIAKTYCFENDLSATLKRISLGNYFGQTVNVSQMLAGHISTISKPESVNIDLNIDLIKHFIDSLNLSKEAFISNPEWTDYRTGQDTIRINLKEILIANKLSWVKYLVEFQNNPELVKIMIENDVKHYKKAKSKTEIKDNGLVRLYFTGLFWLIVLFLIAWIFISIFNSTIPLVLKPFTALFIIVAYTVVGAFILKTTHELSEKRFL